MKRSPQQQDACDWVLKGSGNAIIKAVAGAGKTTLLKDIIVNCLDSKRDNPIYLVFNKRNADEAKQKIPADRCKVSTFHSAGYSVLRNYAPSAKLDTRKPYELAQNIMVPQELRGFVVKAQSLAKGRAFGVLANIEDDHAWYDMIEHYDIAQELPEDDVRAGRAEMMINEGIVYAKKLLYLSAETARDFIDYDDQLWLPLYLKLRFWQHPWVLCDEGQDLSLIRTSIVKKLLKPGGRAIAVGDYFQSINGFAGAENNALDIFKHDFNCIELPLTVSFRCARSVVAHAKQWCDYIQPADNAPEGKVEFIQQSEWDWTQLAKTDAILCRNTKPLVETAYALIAKGIACHVEGRDIGKGLIDLAKKWKRVRNLGELKDKLEEYKEREIQKLLAKGKEMQAAAVEDKVQTLFVVMETLPLDASVFTLTSKIEGIFKDDDETTLTLSTIHKAKGREWDRVWWIGRNLYQPSRYARQEWQIEQEYNLMYVAATRAKLHLIEVSLDRKSKRQRATA